MVHYLGWYIRTPVRECVGESWSLVLTWRNLRPFQWGPHTRGVDCHRNSVAGIGMNRSTVCLQSLLQHHFVIRSPNFWICKYLVCQDWIFFQTLDLNLAVFFFQWEVLIVIEILLDLFHMSPFYTQRSVAV